MKLEPLSLIKTFFLIFIKCNPGITGYELKKFVLEFSNGAIELQSGQIYSELRNLEEQGFLTSHLANDARKKRWYTITKEGEEELNRLYTQIKNRVEKVLVPLLTLIEEKTKN